MAEEPMKEPVEPSDEDGEEESSEEEESDEYSENRDTEDRQDDCSDKKDHSGEEVPSPSVTQEQEHQQDLERRRQVMLRAYHAGLEQLIPSFWRLQTGEVARDSAVQNRMIRQFWTELVTKYGHLMPSVSAQTLPADVEDFLARASYMFTLELIFRSWIHARIFQRNSPGQSNILGVLYDSSEAGGIAGFGFLPVLLREFRVASSNRSAAPINTPASNNLATRDGPVAYGPTSNDAMSHGPTSNDATIDVEQLSNSRPTRNWPTSSDSSSDGIVAISTFSTSSESSSDDNGANSGPTRS